MADIRDGVVFAVCPYCPWEREVLDSAEAFHLKIKHLNKKHTPKPKKGKNSGTDIQ